MPYIIQPNNVVKMEYGGEIKPSYEINDLKSVYTHWNSDKHKNEPTENIINKGVNSNGKDSK